eukprot:3250697-Rhodomonas_salina.1
MSRNLRVLTLAVDAVAGPVRIEPVMSTEGVGSFGETPTISYSPAKAATLTSIFVYFIPHMALAVGDEITLTLPDFTCAADYACDVAEVTTGGGDMGGGGAPPFRRLMERSSRSLNQMDMPGQEGGTEGESDSGTENTEYTYWETGLVVLGSGIGSASWDSDNSQLTLTVNAASDPFSPVSVIVPSTLGITLPDSRFEANSASLTLEAIAVDGNVDAIPFVRSPPIGRFSFSSLTFTSVPVADKTADMRISFQPDMDIAVNETLTVVLGGFTGRDNDDIVVSNTSTIATSAASWNSDLSALIFTFASAVSAGTTVSIDVSSSLGIALPWTGFLAEYVGVSLPFVGVRANQSDITIACSAANGPVQATSFKYTQPVGSFVNTPELAFSPPARAGSAVELTLTFAAKMTFLAGET